MQEKGHGSFASEDLRPLTIPPLSFTCLISAYFTMFYQNLALLRCRRGYEEYEPQKRTLFAVLPIRQTKPFWCTAGFNTVLIAQRWFHHEDTVYARRRINKAYLR